MLPPLDEGPFAMSFRQLGSRFALRRIVFPVWPVLMAVLVAFSVAIDSGLATAADEPAAKKADAAADQSEPAKPEDVQLSTDDELELKATFYPGAKGPESIPVVIIHGLGPKCNRLDFTQAGGLAEYLQGTLGCAVVVPDLRGHGESTKWSDELQKRLREQHKRPKDALKAEKLKPADRVAMLEQDLKAVKDFLWKKNNKKELNLDKLTVIGVEDGAALALSFAAADAEGYEHHRAMFGPLKLGNFLKALVLISPQTRVIGLNASQVLHDQQFQEMRRNLPVMIIAGNQNNLYFNEAKTLQKLFVSGRPKLDSKNKLDDMTVWFYGNVDTKLQGAKLTSEVSLKVPEKIVKFMKTRLIDNPDAKEWVWKERKLPHE
jgi:pimeloyl-ACP methyl ester carboxylesterase